MQAKRLNTFNSKSVLEYNLVKVSKVFYDRLKANIMLMYL